MVNKNNHTNTNRLEFNRQVLHLVVGTITTTLFFYNLITALHLFIILILGITLSLISKYKQIPIIKTFLKIFDRKKDQKILPGKGAITFLVGCLLAIKLFEKDIALASIIILSLGDSISHIVGKMYGKTKNFFNNNNDKLIEGTLAGIICGTLGAVIFVPILESFLAASAAMIAELIEVKLGEKILDDNILIPLVAGTTIVIIRTVI